MLSDDEAKAIEDSIRRNSHGPLLVRWIEALLADRRERVERDNYIKARLGQAFEYLAGLFEERRESVRDAKARARSYRGWGAQPTARDLSKHPTASTAMGELGQQRRSTPRR
jgi:hypothetical protein